MNFKIAEFIKASEDLNSVTFTSISGFYESCLGSGCEARFYEIYWPSFGEIGLKVYMDEEERDFAVDAQRKLHDVDLAPAVYGVVDVRGSSDSYKWGYLTEKAEVLYSQSAHYKEYRDFLQAKARQHGFSRVDDIRYENIGLNSEGNPIIIDCGPLTLDG